MLMAARGEKLTGALLLAKMGGPRDGAAGHSRDCRKAEFLSWSVSAHRSLEVGHVPPTNT